MPPPPIDFSFLTQEKGGVGDVGKEGGGGGGGAGCPPGSAGGGSSGGGIHHAPSGNNLGQNQGHQQHAVADPAHRPVQQQQQQHPNRFPDRPPAFSSSNFTEAFAHMKQTSSYVPPAAPAPAPPPEAGGVGGPVVPKKPPGQKGILVSKKQKGNTLLQHIRNVPWEYADIVPDYIMGSTQKTCALFLSARYHQLKPKYIYGRIEQLQTGYSLRVLLCMIDCEESQKTLLDVHKITLVNGWTLILAWSPEEAARYLETMQSYEHKQADNIQEKVEGDYMSRVTDVLTTIRSVNKTDVANLSTSLGSIASIMTASKERVAMCPGVGSKKVQRLFDAFNQPFLVRKKPKGDEADGGAGGESSVGAAQRARGQEEEEEEEEGDDEMV